MEWLCTFAALVLNTHNWFPHTSYKNDWFCGVQEKIDYFSLVSTHVEQWTLCVIAVVTCKCDFAVTVHNSYLCIFLNHILICTVSPYRIIKSNKTYHSILHEACHGYATVWYTLKINAKIMIMKYDIVDWITKHRLTPKLLLSCMLM